jgi:hypothetical protein
MRKILVTALLFACNKDDKVYYDLFNCDEDYTFIEVGADEVIDDETTCDEIGAGTIVLHSSTCEEEIGSARISPCAAPLGYEHDIIVELNSVYEDNVDKATVRMESEGRGTDEYKMKPDSANQGLYKTTLVSVGIGDERRQDFVRFKLWAVDPDGGDQDD